MGVEHEDRFRDESGQIQDDYRIEFVEDHLKWVIKAVEEGSNCVGYHYLGLNDNWSWANAFKNRYGFVEVDLMDNYSRKLKKSAHWIKNLIEQRDKEDM